MSTCLTRRSFLKQTAATAGALSAAQFNILHAANAGEKVRVVQIGCGGRGMSHLAATADEKVVAIVDVDEKRHEAVKVWLKEKNKDPEKVQVFTAAWRFSSTSTMAMTFSSTVALKWLMPRPPQPMCTTFSFSPALAA
jgi:cyclopropane fatty-acyl-phospholipid synthase-like methyltransferase